VKLENGSNGRTIKHILTESVQYYASNVTLWFRSVINVPVGIFYWPLRLPDVKNSPQLVRPHMKHQINNVVRTETDNNLHTR
jgi:hypothetical protein